MRIGVDAMGGDFAPAGIVQGALEAQSLLDADDAIVLLGDESAIREHLSASKGWERFIQIEPTSQVIAMDESPVEALRQKPDSSIAKMAAMAAAGKLDAIISAGNTGACVAAAQMRLRRLRGVSRPGIAIVTPTYAGPVVMCDVGANIDCRPQHLYQYGLMSAEYARCICGIENPRVALLSIGSEEAKGNALVKETRRLFKSDPEVRFIGNVEGRDMFHGVCDVVVTEGFVGNVVLKLMEGLVEGLFRSTYMELAQSNPDLAGGFGKAISRIKEKYDFNEYGGAPLLGVNGICIICHGASKPRGITNAVRVALNFAKTHINNRITECLCRRGQNEED